MQRTAAARIVAVMLASLQLFAQGKEHPMEHPTFYRTTQIDGLSIFYREAGPKDAPTILLLHGLPSSSRMFDPLFARLADRFHLVAPDYPGFGHTDWPDPKKFAYTFDHLAEIMNHFTEALGLSRYTLYMQDYGGPVGFRMVLAHPERVEALIVQDAVAHNEGLGTNWKTRREFWKDRAANETALRRSEEHTSELQSQSNLVCRLLLEKKKTNCASCSHTPPLTAASALSPAPRRWLHLPFPTATATTGKPHCALRTDPGRCAGVSVCGA